MEQSPREQHGPALRVTVLAGGTSPERNVSLDSGQCVMHALRERGHFVTLLDPAVQPLQSADFTECDVVFPLVHGTGGEDGELQRQLQQLCVPFTGSSAVASELTFNKISTRQKMCHSGIRVATGFALLDDTPWNQVRSNAAELGFPLVVKPAAQGSSVGVSIVADADQLEAAMRTAGRYGPQILLEEYIAGREVTVTVVNGRAFPIIEIVPARPWYDFAAKYQDDGTQYLIEPGDLPVELSGVAVRACQLCGVDGISRVDFRVNKDGEFFLLEINTIPGMTSHSLVPMSAAAMGISLGELCEQVCRCTILRLKQQNSFWK